MLGGKNDDNPSEGMGKVESVTIDPVTVAVGSIVFFHSETRIQRKVAAYADSDLLSVTNSWFQEGQLPYTFIVASCPLCERKKCWICNVKE